MITVITHRTNLQTAQTAHRMKATEQPMRIIQAQRTLQVLKIAKMQTIQQTLTTQQNSLG